VKLSLQNKLSI